MKINTLIEKTDHSSKYAVLLIAFSLPFSTALMNIAIVLASFLIIAGGRWQEKLAAIRSNPIVLWAMLLFLMYLIGMFYSNANWSDRLYVLNKYNKFLLIPLLIPVFLNPDIRKLTIKIFMLAMLIVLVCSYLHYFNLPPFKNHLGFGPGSPFKNHSSANLLMAFSTYLYLLAAYYEKKYRWIYLFIAVVMLINTLFMSDGRIGYLIIIGLLLVFAYMHYSKRGLLIGILLSCILLVSAYHFSSSFRDRTKHILLTSTQQDTSASIRKFQAEIVIKLVKLHPVFGVGTGAFANNYQALSPGHGFSDNAQSQYLQTWAELGTVGLVILLLFLWQQFKWSFKLEPPYNAIALGLVVMEVLSFLTLSSLMDTTESHLFVLFIALCFASLSSRNNYDSK